jgi:hypothetical protein
MQDQERYYNSRGKRKAPKAFLLKKAGKFS